MRITTFIFFVLLEALFSCNTSTDKNLNQTSVDTTLIKTGLDSFLELFPEITFDKLHLYSPSDTTDGKKFEGKVIDSTLRKYFVTDKIIRANIDAGANIFACYKFKLSDSETGLIIRRQSQYSETAIDLCIWLNKDKLIDKEIELADAFGDGEWYFQKDAWLIDLNNDKQFDIVKRKMDYWEDDADSGEGQSHMTDSVMIYLANGDRYEKSKIAIDTTQFKLFGK